MKEFEQALFKLVKESGLPIEAALYVMMHVYSVVDAEYRRLLTEEQKKREQTFTESANDVGGADTKD